MVKGRRKKSKQNERDDIVGVEGNENELRRINALQELDLGNIRAQRIRNEQDEYQDVVDPRALEASRRANQQGTAEATWANRPEAVTALAGWNAFGLSVDPGERINDGSIGQSHRARLAATLNFTQLQTPVVSTFRGGRAGRRGRGGGAVGRAGGATGRGGGSAGRGGGATGRSSGSAGRGGGAAGRGGGAAGRSVGRPSLFANRGETFRPSRPARPIFRAGGRLAARSGDVREQQRQAGLANFLNREANMNTPTRSGNTAMSSASTAQSRPRNTIAPSSRTQAGSQGSVQDFLSNSAHGSSLSDSSSFVKHFLQINGLGKSKVQAEGSGTNFDTPAVTTPVSRTDPVVESFAIDDTTSKGFITPIVGTSSFLDATPVVVRTATLHATPDSRNVNDVEDTTRNSTTNTTDPFINTPTRPSTLTTSAEGTDFSAMQQEVICLREQMRLLTFQIESSAQALPNSPIDIPEVMGHATETAETSGRGTLALVNLPPSSNSSAASPLTDIRPDDPNVTTTAGINPMSSRPTGIHEIQERNYRPLEGWSESLIDNMPSEWAEPSTSSPFISPPEFGRLTRSSQDSQLDAMTQDAAQSGLPSIVTSVVASSNTQGSNFGVPDSSPGNENNFDKEVAKNTSSTSFPSQVPADQPRRAARLRVPRAPVGLAWVLHKIAEDNKKAEDKKRAEALKWFEDRQWAEKENNDNSVVTKEPGPISPLASGDIEALADPRTFSAVPVHPLAGSIHNITSHNRDQVPQPVLQINGQRPGDYLADSIHAPGNEYRSRRPHASPRPASSAGNTPFRHRYGISGPGFALSVRGIAAAGAGGGAVAQMGIAEESENEVETRDADDNSEQSRGRSRVRRA